MSNKLVYYMWNTGDLFLSSSIVFIYCVLIFIGVWVLTVWINEFFIVLNLFLYTILWCRCLYCSIPECTKIYNDNKETCKGFRAWGSNTSPNHAPPPPCFTAGTTCLVFIKHGFMHYDQTSPLWSHLPKGLCSRRVVQMQPFKPKLCCHVLKGLLLPMLTLKTCSFSLNFNI